MDTSIPPRQETARETPYFAGRLKTLGVLGAFLIFVLVSRLTYLCVIHGDSYLTESQEQIYRQESIPPPRGVIFDRFGRLLATNRITYSVYLSPNNLTTDTLSLSVARLEQLTGESIPPQQTHKKLKRPKDPARPLQMPFTKLLLCEGLSLEMAMRIAERQALEMPGVSVVEAFERTYDTHNCTQKALNHVIGYIGALSPRDVERAREEGREIDPETDRIGKKNIEAAYDHLLRGEKGSQNQVYDSRGRRIGEPEVLKTAVSGSNLVLTLDADLQMHANELVEAFGREILDERGQPLKLGAALVAMDPRNGEVLALASAPDFNNRVLDGRFSPGSTFKLVTAAAGLREGYSPTMTFNCNKYWRFGNRTFKCLFHHHDLDLYNALRASCNVYFFELGSLLRWGKIADAAYDFGFGQSPGIDFGSGGRKQTLDLPRESEETLLNGDVIQMGIGQGAKVDVSPLQMLVAYSAVANVQGLRMRPHLLKETIHPDGRREPYHGEPGEPSPASDPLIREDLIKGFRLVVESKNGTANKAEFDPNWKVAGKTGSAEYYNCQPNEENAWFAGFAPWDDPEICVVVLCERAGHGGDVAAPVAKAFLETYFNRTRPRLQLAATNPVLQVENGSSWVPPPDTQPASAPASQPVAGE